MKSLNMARGLTLVKELNTFIDNYVSSMNNPNSEYSIKGNADEITDFILLLNELAIEDATIVSEHITKETCAKRT